MTARALALATVAALAAATDDPGVDPDRGPHRSVTYYVAPAGSDASPGTRERPFATIAHAATVAGPGDTVLVRGGVYNSELRLRRSGTDTAPITFRAHPGEVAVIDGTGRRQEEGLVRIDGDHVTFRGFEVRRSGSPSSLRLPSIFVDGRYVTVQDNHVHHGSSVGIRIWTPRSGNHAVVLGNHVHDMDDGEKGNADCVSLGGHPPGPYDYGDPRAANVVIRDNLLHDCTDDGIDTWDVAGNLIEGNVVYRNGQPGWSSRLGQDGNGLKIGGDGPGGHNVVRYNVTFDNARRGIVTNGGSGNLVYGNTVFRNASDGVQATRVPLGAGAPNRFYNNISQRNGTDFTKSLASGGVIDEKNTWNLGLRDCAFLSTTPPRAIDIEGFRSSGFLHLSPASACVDRGVASIDGRALAHRGAAPDLGAYEAR